MRAEEFTRRFGVWPEVTRLLSIGRYGDDRAVKTFRNQNTYRVWLKRTGRV